MKMIFDSCNYIAKFAPKKSLLIIKSTLLPGTSDIFQSKIKKKNRNDISIIYSPERLAEGTALKDLEKNKIIISSPSTISLNRAEKIFKKCSLEVIKFKDYQSAEITKLANNLWIDINIAIGNELSVYCKSKNLDSIPIIEAANSIKKGSNYVNILKPSIGVGGYCLPKDPYFIYEDAKKNNVNLKLPKIGRNINNNITNYSANKIIEFIKKNKIKKAKIIILGVAFKNNTGDVRSTPIKKLVNIFKKYKYDYQLYDPLVNFEKVKFFDKNRVKDNPNVLEYDVIVFGCAHRDFKTIKFPKISKNKNKLIFDGRQFLSTTDIKKLINKNFNIFILMRIRSLVPMDL